MPRGFLPPYMSKTILSILAVSNKTDFCTIPTLNLMPSVCIHPLKPYNHWYNLILFQRTKPFQLSLQILLFFNLSDFFLSYTKITWYSNNNTFLSTKIKSGLLASIHLPHWIFISQINSTSSSSTTHSGQCSYHLSFLSRFCFSNNVQWTNFATVSCLLLYSRYATFYIHILYAAQFLPFHRTFYIMDFPMFCQFYSLYNLSLMLVLVQLTSLLQFALCDHFEKHQPFPR